MRIFSKIKSDIDGWNLAELFDCMKVYSLFILHQPHSKFSKFFFYIMFLEFFHKRELLYSMLYKEEVDVYLPYLQIYSREDSSMLND